ncbi:MAG: 30S ribosomal protein S6 [Fimbriimonadaceae bacterium]
MKKNQYETMYIVRPELGDADVQKLADRYAAVVVDHGGEVASAGKWDKRKLAYEIDGYKEGTYVLMQFTAPPGVPAELSRLLGINDDVIRHRIFSIDA